MTGRISAGCNIDDDQFFYFIGESHSKVHRCFATHGVAEYYRVLDLVVIHEFGQVAYHIAIVEIVAVGGLTVVPLVDGVDVIMGGPELGLGHPIVRRTKKAVQNHDRRQASVAVFPEEQLHK